MRFLARVLAAALFITLFAGVGLPAPAEAAARPSAPRAVKAAPLNKAVKVTWAAPASSSGSRVDAYAVQQRNSGTTKWVNVKYTTGSGRSATVGSLENGALYYFRVLARNRSGWGSPSASVAVRPRTVPAVPRRPEADTYVNALGVYWTEPSSTGGASVDYYRVEISTDAATWTTPKSPKVRPTSAAPVMFSGLAPGTRYWFRVRAHNAAGFSPPSGFGPYTAKAAPGPVTDLVADPGDTVVDLSWTAPEFDPKKPSLMPPATSYQVERSPDGLTGWTVLGTTTTTGFQATGLVNGVSYHFRVRAANDNVRGFGPGLVVQSDPPLGAPSAPQNATLTWDADADAHRFGWGAPASDGGVALTRYEVGHTPAGSGPPVSGTDVGLVAAVDATAATTDEYVVRACNTKGCGPWSGDVGPVPGSVTALDGEALHGTSGYVVTLDWTAPSNAAVAPVTSYTVERSTDGVTFAALGTSPTATFTDSTALADTDYTYRVAAVGADGASAPAPVLVETGPPQALSAPAGPLAVTEGEETSFLVGLAAPPAVDTVVSVTSDDPDAAAPTQPTVTILAGTTSASVTVAGTEDDDLVAASATLTLTAGAWSDTVVVDVSDDDTQAILTTPGSVQAEADGPGVELLVTLAHEPGSEVTVSVESDATNKATVSAPSVVLTPANWDTGVPVTVFGESPGSATLTFSAPGLPDVTVEVTVG